MHDNGERLIVPPKEVSEIIYNYRHSGIREVLLRESFDLAEELHLPFDAVAIAYRKAMQEFGFSNSC